MEAYRMMETTPADLSPTHLLHSFVPLRKGSSYPVFNKYPSFIVDYQVRYTLCVLVSVWLLLVLSQVQERERIRQEESEYLRQRSIFLCILYFVHDISSLLFFLTTVACNHTSVHKYFQIYISIPINSIAILYII